MKPAPPPVKIGSPCPKKWSELEGGDKQRYCSECQLHVHNLSAMSAPERNEFIENGGERKCIAYTLRADGTMVTPSRWPRLARLFRPVRWAALSCAATLLPFWFAGCASRKTATLGVPVMPKDDQARQMDGATVGVMVPVPKNQEEPGKPHQH